MADIKIVVDSGADIPEDIAKKYDIGIISFISLFGEEQYVHLRDITNAEFYDKLESFDGFPTTSQTPYADMLGYFSEQCREHESVIYIALSSAASGQYQTANLVREEILEENPNADFHIVDSQKFSVYIARGAVYAAELVKTGMSAAEIAEKCGEFIMSWRCFLLVDTLKYLEKGGRLSKTAAFVGTMLDIKPILAIENGLVENADKLRGRKRLVDKLIEKIKEYPEFDAENPRFLIVQSDDKKGKEAQEKLEAEFGGGCVEMYTEFGPLIGTHVGRGAIAILAHKK